MKSIIIIPEQKVRHDKVIKKRSFSASSYSMSIGSVAAITIPVRKVKSTRQLKYSVSLQTVLKQIYLAIYNQFQSTKRYYPIIRNTTKSVKYKQDKRKYG